MAERFLDRVRNIFAQVTGSDTVKRSAATARETATGLGHSAQDVAKEAAGKVKAAGADLGDKAKESANDRSLKGSRSDQKATEVEAPATTGVEPNPEADVDGLSASAQATIDDSRQQTNAFIRDAAVELETAPDNVPGDAEEIVTDPDVESPVTGEEVDDAVRGARTDHHRE